jgi:hypothetical protein
VADAMAPGHDVELTRPHRGVGAEAVPVLELAGEQPANRLEPGVRVRRDEHAAGGGHLIGAVVVGETPRAEQGSSPLRERAPHSHRAHAAEGHLPGVEHLDGRPGHVIGFCDRLTAHHLDGPGFEVAHRRFRERSSGRKRWTGAATVCP